MCSGVVSGSPGNYTSVYISPLCTTVVRSDSSFPSVSPTTIVKSRGKQSSTNTSSGPKVSVVLTSVEVFVLDSIYSTGSRLLLVVKVFGLRPVRRDSLISPDLLKVGPFYYNLSKTNQTNNI